MPKLKDMDMRGAMNGDELWINTDDEKITIVIKDRDLRWHLYCKTLKITIEEIEEKNG